MEVVDPKTQQTVAVSTAFGSNPSILSAVDTVTGELRTQLGENRDSIRQNSPALPDVTTSSLDALRAYALGQQRYSEGKYGAALDFFQKAVDIDPHFALAWLGQVRAHFANVDYKKATETLRVAEQFKSRLPARGALRKKLGRADSRSSAGGRFLDTDGGVVSRLCTCPSERSDGLVRR